MQGNRRSSGLSWSLWAIVILLWAANAAGDRKVTDIALGASPQSLAVDPGTNKIYVTSNLNSVYVVDAVTYAVVTTLTVGNSPGTGPNGITANTKTHQIYVADYGSNTVSVIDGTNGSYPVHSVAVGNEPLNVAVNESTNTIYVTNYQDNTVSAISCATVPETVTTIKTGAGPRWLAVNPTTNKVYVANQRDGTVTVIDGATNLPTSITVAPAATPLSAIAVNILTNQIYVGANPNYNAGIAVIDGTNNAVTNVVIGKPSWGVAVNSTMNKVYVTNYLDNVVSVIDGGNNNSLSTVSVANQPQSIAIYSTSTLNRAYVASSLGNTIAVIDGATNQTTTVTVGSGSYSEPSSLGVDASLNLVFVANKGSNSVSVIDTSETLANSAPTVSITSPASGSSISQTVTIQANAAASSGLTLAGVQFQLDGLNLGPQMTSAPYAMSWDTTQTTNGSHIITAMATDSMGTAASSSVSVTISNSITDFVLSVQSAAATVAPGGTAKYLLTLVSGSFFSGTVSLTCSGAPTTTVCSIPPSQQLSAGSTVPVTVTLATSGQSASAAQPRRGRAPFTFALALLAPFALAAWRGTRRKLIWRLVTGGLLAVTMVLASCGGTGGNEGKTAQSTSTSASKSTGTPAGTYTLTITGTSGTLTRVINLTLTVT